jgi:2'-5' RNA ligase
MKRTFVAVKVEAGEELKDSISSLRSGLRSENIKWVDINNMHVTLAFIGDTDAPAISGVESMLEEKFEGFGNIDFKLTGFGLFRTFHDPRIVFSVIENPGRLVAAHELVKDGLRDLDIKLEERQFNPHLTIARIKDLRDKNNLQKLIQKYAGVELQTVIISEIVYYESVLLPTGPIYKPISKVLLR